MTNHISNWVRLKTEEAWKPYLVGGLVDFNTVLPMPAHVKADQDAEPSGPDPLWYSWSIANWGTKWNAYSQEDHPYWHEKTGWRYFETAWGAPMPIVHALAAKHAELFEWF